VAVLGVVVPAGERAPGTSAPVPERPVHTEGDGPRSYDSRRVGPLPLENVVGLVIARLSVRR
jgi:hypothetical protein